MLNLFFKFLKHDATITEIKISDRDIMCYCDEQKRENQPRGMIIDNN